MYKNTGEGLNFAEGKIDYGLCNFIPLTEYNTHYQTFVNKRLLNTQEVFKVHTLTLMKSDFIEVS